MQRKRTDPPKLDAEELPELTSQQRLFIEGILAGKSASDAYRAAYDCRNSLDSTVWCEASKLRSNPTVAQWLSAARQAHLGQGTVTLESHIRELERLKEIAIATGNVGAAVQAEQLRGKAQGHYVERMDLNVHDTDNLLNQIREIAPELAERLEATEH